MLQPTIFQNDEHRDFYEKAVQAYGHHGQAQHVLSCLYLLGLDAIRGWAREYWDAKEAYPKNADKVLTDPRLSSTTRQCMRLAFQLRGWSGDTMHNIDEIIDDWEYSRFYAEAIRIRICHC